MRVGTKGVQNKQPIKKSIKGGGRGSEERQEVGVWLHCILDSGGEPAAGALQTAKRAWAAMPHTHLTQSGAGCTLRPAGQQLRLASQPGPRQVKHVNTQKGTIKHNDMLADPAQRAAAASAFTRQAGWFGLVGNGSGRPRLPPVPQARPRHQAQAPGPAPGAGRLRLQAGSCYILHEPHQLGRLFRHALLLLSALHRQLLEMVGEHLGQRGVGWGRIGQVIITTVGL